MPRRTKSSHHQEEQEEPQQKQAQSRQHPMPSQAAPQGSQHLQGQERGPAHQAEKGPGSQVPQFPQQAEAAALAKPQERGRRRKVR